MTRAIAWSLAMIVIGGCVAVEPEPVSPAPSRQAVSPSAPAEAASPTGDIATPPSPTSEPTLSAEPSPSDPVVSGGPVIVFPTAPPGTAGWPTCTTFQLAMSGEVLGAGLGNVAALFRLRNVSDEGCSLEGYPGIQLIARSGAALPTTVQNAVNGAYLFLAVRPQRVAIGPGDTASFELAYGDNPVGDGENLPYDVACPPTGRVRITLPGTHQFGTAEVTIAPCAGWVSPSPIYPGRDRIPFE